MKAKLLLYHVPKTKTAQLRTAVSPLHIALHEVLDDEIGQRVGALAEIEGFEKEENASAPIANTGHELMLMCGLSSLQFDLLMSMFQRKKLPPITVKAMLTPTNQDWRFCDLVQEVYREHQTMHPKKV